MTLLQTLIQKAYRTHQYLNKRSKATQNEGISLFANIFELLVCFLEESKDFAIPRSWGVGPTEAPETYEATLLVARSTFHSPPYQTGENTICLGANYGAGNFVGQVSLHTAIRAFFWSTGFLYNRVLLSRSSSAKAKEVLMDLTISEPVNGNPKHVTKLSQGE